MGHNNHSHGHSHGNHSGDNASKNIWVALLLNGFFVVVEVVGGLLTNSIAILSDALHDFGDCLSLAVAWGLQKKSTKGRDSKYSYGYKRFSLLGSVFLGGVLSLSSVFVIVEAVGRITNPQSVHAQGMLWIALVGIAVNGAAALRLKRGNSLSERAVFLHIIEDVLGWVGVLVVSVVMMFVDLPVLDPILSIVISLWVLSNVYKNLRDTFKIMLQATPPDVDVDKLQNELLQLPGVESLHDLHLWTMDGNSHIMTLHLVISDIGNNGQATKDNVIAIAKEYSIDHVTVELESSGTICTHNCP